MIWDHIFNSRHSLHSQLKHARQQSADFTMRANDMPTMSMSMTIYVTNKFHSFSTHSWLDLVFYDFLSKSFCFY